MFFIKITIKLIKSKSLIKYLPEYADKFSFLFIVLLKILNKSKYYYLIKSKNTKKVLVKTNT